MLKIVSAALLLLATSVRAETAAVSLSDKFISNFGPDEAACIAAAASSQVAGAEGGSDLGSGHVVDAMRTGWWRCAEALAGAWVSSMSSAAASTRFADLQNVVALEARAISGRISALKSSLESARPPSQVISPALQWAQSPHKVFLNVKFSHKIDAPATLDVSVDSVDLQGSSLSLQASKDRKLFVLELPSLWGPIDPELSSWSLASVGRAVFTLHKVPKDGSDGGGSKWPSLLARGSPKPKSQMHAWWDRQAEFQKALDALPDEDDDDDDDDGADKAEKKSKSKKQRGEKKKAKKEKKAKKSSQESADSSAPPSLEDGEGGAPLTGFVAEAVKAIEAEKKEALAALEKTASEKKAQIESETALKKKELALETKAEKAKIEAQFAALAEEAKGGEGEENKSDGGGDAADVEVDASAAAGDKDTASSRVSEEL